ncbi:DUF397 domain-containing protein [Amycolatopsis sp. NPDC059021]|uniref:DUF397 domain-containing protein n=1 Tax=Amycolatopsis sp. NPDC059021 TaxID=3346704 RepID=UPI00366DCDBC
MSTVDFSAVGWRKSSYSEDGTGGNCVEVAATPQVIGVRDSKAPVANLSVSAAAWVAFLESTRR